MKGDLLNFGEKKSHQVSPSMLPCGCPRSSDEISYGGVISVLRRNAVVFVLYPVSKQQYQMKWQEETGRR